LNDLDLITQLIDRPAEFLLYLQRRRHPAATAMYIAPDELDLFLYFLRTGLYVEPEPEMIAAELEWIGQTRTADRRRHAAQSPALVTSHTDQLDAWYVSLHPPQQSAGTPDPAPKPTMTKSPLDT
jgi:hypothetical protein